MYVSERMDTPAIVLTAKQAEIVDMVARGYTSKEIAARQRVTQRAITAQLSRLMRKFDVPNRAGLIAAVMSAAGVGLPTGATERRVLRSRPCLFVRQSARGASGRSRG